MSRFKDFLKPFYGVMKYEERYQRFTFITGVSKFSKVSIFSDLNNLKDYTLNAVVATLFGYTHEEVRGNFPQSIAALGEKLGKSPEDTFGEIVKWYDGYRFEENAEPVINPVSLGMTFDSMKLSNWWSKTAIPTFLIDFFRKRPIDVSNLTVDDNDLDAYEPERIKPVTLLFMPGFDMAFDGVAAYKSVNVPTLMVADAVTISGDGNYVFGGAGSIDANTLTVNLSGNTMATLNGGGISAPDIVIAGGTLKLTTNLVAGALGPGPDGRITVADGGRLAFEYLYTNTANAAYSSLVYDKDIHIAGHGPDGEGALYHANSLANNMWFSTLGRVTLDADASIGGNARIDFRAGWSGRTYKGRPQIYGPGKTLTVKVRLANRSAQMGLDLNNTDVEVGKVVVDEGASLGAEGTVNWNIPGGVDLLDGARLDCYNTTVVGTGTIRIKAGCTAEIRGLNSNSFLFVPVIVEEGTTLLLSGGSTVCFEGGLDNRGAIRQTAGGLYFRDDGTVNGLEITNLTYEAGTLYIGQAVQGGIPKFGKFEVAGESTGTIYLRTAEDTVIDGTKFVVKAPKAQIRFLSRTNPSDSIENIPRITVKNAAGWEIGRLRFGDKTYCGSVVFDGGTVTAGYMQTSEDTDHLAGRIELVNGASLSITNSGTAVSLASTTSRSEMREHQVIVGPGCTLSTPNGAFINGYSAPYAHFEMDEGSTVNLKGVWGRRRYNGIPASAGVKHDSVFRMNGGTLNIGAWGFLAGYPAYAGSSQTSEPLNVHYNESGPVFRLNNGTLGAFEDTVDSNSYRAPGVNIAFGERGDLAGKVSITPNGHVLNLRTGLKGYSDVTVKGSGTFQSSRYSMGIPRGRWKVEAGVDAQLHGAAGFAGGLELAPGATASVCAASTNLVEAYVGSQLRLPRRVPRDGGERGHVVLLRKVRRQHEDGDRRGEPDER